MSRGPHRRRLPEQLKTTVDYYKLQFAAARSFMRGMPMNEVVDMFKVSVGQVKYWMRKLKVPTFHSGRHGGFRWCKLTSQDKPHLYMLGKLYPQSLLQSIATVLQKLTGTKVSTFTICRFYQSLGWRFKNVEYKQKLKYTVQNVDRWLNHVRGMPELVKKYGMNNIKYLDEVHLVSKDLDKKNGLGQRGKSIVIERWSYLKESYSMTLMTTPNKEIPIIAEIREGSNTQYDYALFIADCIRGGYLRKGDILLIDNASVHVGADTFSLIVETLGRLGIELLLLPTCAHLN
jgi:transposase